MKCEGPNYLAKFTARPNRFLAKVILNSPTQSEKVIEAHVPDPGRLKELLRPNVTVLLRKSSKQTRKTQYSLIGVKTGNLWVNIDSHLTNRLFKEEFHKIPRFRQYKIIQSEYTYRNSRLDFLMLNVDSKQKALVEIKSVTLVKNELALFPDAPTIRGVKHVNDLINAVYEEYQSFIVFMIKRSDGFSFKPNKDLDPLFSQALINAEKKGVQVCAVRCSYDPLVKGELNVLGEVPIKYH